VSKLLQDVGDGEMLEQLLNAASALETQEQPLEDLLEAAGASETKEPHLEELLKTPCASETQEPSLEKLLQPACASETQEPHLEELLKTPCASETQEPNLEKLLQPACASETQELSLETLLQPACASETMGPDLEELLKAPCASETQRDLEELLQPCDLALENKELDLEKLLHSACSSGIPGSDLEKLMQDPCTSETEKPQEPLGTAHASDDLINGPTLEQLLKSECTSDAMGPSLEQLLGTACASKTQPDQTSEPDLHKLLEGVCASEIQEPRLLELLQDPCASQTMEPRTRELLATESCSSENLLQNPCPDIQHVELYASEIGAVDLQKLLREASEEPLLGSDDLDLSELDLDEDLEQMLDEVKARSKSMVEDIKDPPSLELVDLTCDGEDADIDGHALSSLEEDLIAIMDSELEPHVPAVQLPAGNTLGGPDEQDVQSLEEATQEPSPDALEKFRELMKHQQPGPCLPDDPSSLKHMIANTLNDILQDPKECPKKTWAAGTSTCLQCVVQQTLCEKCISKPQPACIAKPAVVDVPDSQEQVQGVTFQQMAVLNVDPSILEAEVDDDDCGGMDFSMSAPPPVRPDCHSEVVKALVDHPPIPVTWMPTDAKKELAEKRKEEAAAKAEAKRKVKEAKDKLAAQKRALAKEKADLMAARAEAKATENAVKRGGLMKEAKELAAANQETATPKADAKKKAQQEVAAVARPLQAESTGVPVIWPLECYWADRCSTSSTKHNETPCRIVHELCAYKALTTIEFQTSLTTVAPNTYVHCKPPMARMKQCQLPTHLQQSMSGPLLPVPQRLRQLGLFASMFVQVLARPCA